MYPEVLIFGYPLSTYSLMALIGGAAVVLYIYLTNRGGRAGRLPGSDVLNLLCLVLAGIIVGGKLLGFITMVPVVIQHWALIATSFMNVVSALFATFVFYGGLLGALLAIYFYCRKYNISLRLVFGLVTPAIPLFHSIARVGCFLAGCCWGIEVPWGLAFSASPVAPNHIHLMPVQLFEAAFNLLLFIALAVLSRRLVQKWRCLPIYFLAYGSGRFILEFFRGDRIRGHLWIFSTSQWVSLGLIAAAVVMLIKYRGDRQSPADDCGTK